MARMTPREARAILARVNVDKDADFHTLASSVVDDIITEADVWNYTKPRNANGSRARCFFEYVQRTARAIKDKEYTA